MDPTTGFMTYKGMETPEWDTKPYNVFSVNPTKHKALELEYLYADIVTGNVRWAYLPSSGWILSLPSGMQQVESFDEEDFFIEQCAKSRLISSRNTENFEVDMSEKRYRLF